MKCFPVSEQSKVESKKLLLIKLPMKCGLNSCLFFRIRNLSRLKCLKILLIPKSSFKTKGTCFCGLSKGVIVFINMLKYFKLLRYRKTLHLIKKRMLFSILINSFGHVWILFRPLAMKMENSLEIISK